MVKIFFEILNIDISIPTMRKAEEALSFFKELSKLTNLELEERCQFKSLIIKSVNTTLIF